MPEGRMPSALTTVGGAPLSRVGLGTAAFGMGGTGDDLADATFRHAIDLGINWIDTDAIFGFGGAERLVGRTLAELPAGDRPFIATAVGFDWDGRSRRATPQPAMEPRRLRQQLERSLGRLGVEAVDLVKLNLDAGSDALFEDAWSTLLDLKQGGLVRAVGLIAPDSARLERAERIGACDAVYVELSLIDRRVGDSELLWRRTPTPTVIAYRALGGGGLVAPDDPAGEPALGPLRHLIQTIAGRRHATPPAVAAAWSLTWPGVAGVAVGARCPEQVAAVAPAPEIELSVRDLSDIANLLPTLGAGRGPLHPRRFAKAA
ncbi:putative aldo/keto reductase [uncultured Pleomorphomonas sp.]|uniref:Putative aldo/keto reductase n=2 Tax=uncultured Pleomorphomonas sp. TaxID=442121 RepID=A0A212LH92_9HYPH|nr:putative aldo/keto reductase [uncultured Pleomorphomonas sp.]